MVGLAPAPPVPPAHMDGRGGLDQQGSPEKGECEIKREEQVPERAIIKANIIRRAVVRRLPKRA